jgi:hypothetical protein
MTKLFLLWISYIPISIINGILRESWYKKFLGELGVNVTGFLVLSSTFLLYVYLFFRNNINDFTNKELFLKK